MEVRISLLPGPLVAKNPGVSLLRLNNDTPFVDSHLADAEGTYWYFEAADPYHPLTEWTRSVIPAISPATSDPGCYLIYRDIFFPYTSLKKWHCLRWCIYTPEYALEHFNIDRVHYNAHLLRLQVLWPTCDKIWGHGYSRTTFDSKCFICIERTFPSTESHFFRWVDEFLLLNFISSHSFLSPNPVAHTVLFGNVFPCWAEILSFRNYTQTVETLRPLVLPKAKHYELRYRTIRQRSRPPVSSN